MSRDIKYIGMDVHKEATVIVVLNGSGKLVMESIVETKASSILQFIHGLRGELHVTWGEGTWAAWLYPAPINVDVNVNALENGWTDGREGPWDLSHRVGSGSTLAPGRLIGTRDLAMASNSQPASFSSDAAVQFCETNPPLDQTSTGDRSGQRD